MDIAILIIAALGLVVGSLTLAYELWRNRTNVEVTWKFHRGPTDTYIQVINRSSSPIFVEGIFVEDEGLQDLLQGHTFLAFGSGILITSLDCGEPKKNWISKTIDPYSTSFFPIEYNRNGSPLIIFKKVGAIIKDGFPYWSGSPRMMKSQALDDLNSIYQSSHHSQSRLAEIWQGSKFQATYKFVEPFSSTWPARFR
jgi:hypothetical protein